MKTYCHAPWVPEELEPLLDLAYNFWWSSDREANWLFDRMSNGMWGHVKRNPVRLLRLMGRQALLELRHKPEFVERARAVRNRMRADLEKDSHFRLHATTHGEAELSIETNPLAAYFSAEFGIHESLPIYSGGLGVLAGDHIRSTSDLKVPFVGVGLLYRLGYFHQHFSLDNWQLEEFLPHGFHDLPIKQLIDDDGKAITISLELPDRVVEAQLWLAQVGSSSLILLDTYMRSNWREDRDITARLYDSDRETRLQQEIVLGVGGVRALTALGVKPHRYHMNEGHSAFLVLERAADLIAESGLSLAEAQAQLRPSNVFTTHTPVAAGHEVFRRELMEPYFVPQLKRLNIGPDQFFELGHRTGTEQNGEFEMTSLAIRFSERLNGVSKLHGEVAREQWHCMWPDRKEQDVPISHITNGVHIATWIGAPMQELFDRYLGSDWLEKQEQAETWRRVADIPADELWRARGKQRAALIENAKRRAQRQLIARNVDRETLDQHVSRLDPEALTIGFARRFATYKRADLFFRHRDVLERLLNDPERPMQMLFAGKAHPADEAGKKVLQSVIELSLEPAFLGKLFVIEDYEMGFARFLVQGSDVWMNTPRPPKEASGTSGMKACPNGALTLSTKDGWWVEGANDLNGWTIGEGSDPAKSDEEMDAEDAADLSHLLEHEVVPTFYDRGPSGLPERWIERVRASIASVTPFFNTSRMVREYTERCYLD
ncbi:MAG: alpha-glucan family phosphorylase [Planctomycetota bacterium]